MSQQSFTNELARALARHDIDRLRTVVRVYHDWSIQNLAHQADEWHEELDVWFHASDDDQELALALIVLCMATYDDPRFLALVAAGPLEELFWRDRRTSEECIQRILDEARRTPRFRWMLSGIWTMSAQPEHAKAIKEIVGEMTCDDPLPPRPWS